MKILKTWNIRKDGWHKYFTEVPAHTSGRTDRAVMARIPGVLLLVEAEGRKRNPCLTPVDVLGEFKPCGCVEVVATTRCLVCVKCGYWRGHLPQEATA